MFVDTILKFAFSVTGSRRISLLIGARRQRARWNAAVDAHLAAGGTVVTTQTAQGESVCLVPTVDGPEAGR